MKIVHVARISNSKSLAVVLLKQMRIKYNNLIAIVILPILERYCLCLCLQSRKHHWPYFTTCRYSGHAFDLQFSTSFIFLQQSFNTVATYGLITNVCAFICCNTLMITSQTFLFIFHEFIIHCSNSNCSNMKQFMRAQYKIFIYSTRSQLKFKLLKHVMCAQYKVLIYLFNVCVGFDS